MARGSGGGVAPLIAAKMVCCGGLALIFLGGTGALSGFGAWLTGVGYMWIGVLASALFIGIAVLYRRRGRADAREGASAALDYHPDRPVW